MRYTSPYVPLVTLIYPGKSPYKQPLTLTSAIERHARAVCHSKGQGRFTDI
jgi:hypothetical protein